MVRTKAKRKFEELLKSVGVFVTWQQFMYRKKVLYLMTVVITSYPTALEKYEKDLIINCVGFKLN